MASLRLKRKSRMNALRGKNKNQVIKFLNSKPVIKKVDVEEIKKSFQEKK